MAMFSKYICDINSNEGYCMSNKVFCTFNSINWIINSLGVPFTFALKQIILNFGVCSNLGGVK